MPGFFSCSIKFGCANHQSFELALMNLPRNQLLTPTQNWPFRGHNFFSCFHTLATAELVIDLLNDQQCGLMVGDPSQAQCLSSVMAASSVDADSCR